LEVKYVNPGFPVEIGLAAGGDSSTAIGNNMGFQLTVAKRW
jgi:hypothetical protein